MQQAEHAAEELSCTSNICCTTNIVTCNTNQQKAEDYVDAV